MVFERIRLTFRCLIRFCGGGGTFEGSDNFDAEVAADFSSGELLEPAIRRVAVHPTAMAIISTTSRGYLEEAFDQEER